MRRELLEMRRELLGVRRELLGMKRELGVRNQPYEREGLRLHIA